MTVYEYDDLIKTIRNARRRAKCARERGDDAAYAKACHEEEMADYALGRLVEGQERITRSMCGRN
jgi:hypothetical protein